MSLYEHPTEFAGKTIVEYSPENGITDTDKNAYRVALDSDEIWGNASENATWTDKFAAFLQDPNVGAVTALVIGLWGESDAETDPVVEAIASARERLPHLTALFLGDIISEENEISWIQQTDVSPLLEAYPALEHFHVKGGTGLSLGTPRLEQLKSLVIETGGLSANVVREVWAAHLPSLEHLELWLGDTGYGGDATVGDIRPIFTEPLFPKMTYLGLRDSEIADEIAIAIADAPVLRQLHTLDLSLGTLGDEGAAALLASPLVAGLKKMDIHHHYCSEEMTAKLEALGMDVDAGEREEDDDGDRYVAVSE